MWTAIYMAEGEAQAREIEKKLFEEGFLVKIKPFIKQGEERLYKILVPEFEAEEAQNVLLHLGF